MTAKPQRVFSATQLPDDIPQSIREVLQGFAQSIDQLVTGFQSITPATSPDQVHNNSTAGNFNGVFVIGTVLVANTPTKFAHQLGRTPIGAFELMTVPQANQAKVPATQVACAIALLSVSNNQIIVTSTAANRQFTLIVM